MAKQALPANLHQLWVFGQSYDFYVVTSTIALNTHNFRNSSNQKTQIVLHNTAGNSAAEDTISYWNTGGPGQTPVGAGANFVVERKLTAQAARPAGGGGDQPDTGLVDAVRIIDEDQAAYHAGNPHQVPNIGLNQTSVGIEISNFGEELVHPFHTPNHNGGLYEPDGMNGWHVPPSPCPG